MGFTMIGLGEPRGVQGSVVGGTYFEVMSLRPVLGRLIGPQDDGPNAAGVIVLTYRFWSTVCWIPCDVVIWLSSKVTNEREEPSKVGQGHSSRLSK
jgi:hypothetical protein